MKGLRFYRDSVSSSIHEGAVFFHHGTIETERSDFDCIFYPLYSELSEKYILNDQLPVPCEEDEYNEYLKYKDYIIQDNENYLVVKGGVLRLCGKNIPEFEGNLLTVTKSIPLPMSWREYCDYVPLNLENIDCLISNWDGVYWEIYSLNEYYFKRLIDAHQGNNHLELYWVDLDHDYPQPKRKKEDLSKV